MVIANMREPKRGARMNNRIRHAATMLALGVSGLALVPLQAVAREPSEQQFSFSLPVQPLGAALQSIAETTGVEIIYEPKTVEGKAAGEVRGNLHPDAAVRAALSGTGLRLEENGGAMFIRGRDEAPTALTSHEIPSGIVVTGSRIRGAVAPSPVISTSREEIRAAGMTDLADFARSVPQNYNGGQNQSVAFGAGGYGNENVNAASAFNLRGLGADATLTLLNGRRLAYTSVVQAADISAIPLAAIERVEIMLDGASAIYGSDAVGGVANVILRRDYEGVEFNARVGGSTSGGNSQGQFSAVAGTKWDGGGVVVTGNYAANSSIRGGQRSYAMPQGESATLYPAQEVYGGLISAHHDLASNIEISGDFLYSRRETQRNMPFTSAGSIYTFGLFSTNITSSYVLSPELKFRPGGDWEISLQGSVGADDSSIYGDRYSAGSVILHQDIHYDNSFWGAEINADGPLLDLPGGQLKLAIGAGVREAKLSALYQTFSSTSHRIVNDFTESQEGRYGYVELNAPLVSAAMAVPGVHSLTLTGAVRYEDYPGLDHLATPKFGAVYSPVAGLDLRASWGKSFKVPTLYERYRSSTAYLGPVSDAGSSSGLPAGTTVIDIYGGNSDLQAERATNLTAGLVARPTAIPNLVAQLSYFRTKYTDRVREPVSGVAPAFSNAAYAPFIIRNPSPEQVMAILATVSSPLQNYTDGEFDPAMVSGILDARLINTASQTIQGVDAAVDYAFDLTDIDRVSMSVSATYLHSRQMLVDGGADIAMAGTIFNPPHWRGRAGLAWDHNALGLSAYVNYTGPVTDTRYTPSRPGSDFVTLDINGRYFLSGDRRSYLSLAVSNVLGTKPPRITSIGPTQAPWDSTNYNAFGRTINLSANWAL